MISVFTALIVYVLNFLNRKKNVFAFSITFRNWVQAVKILPHGRHGLSYTNCSKSLHWRHNDHDGVSNHQPHGCLLNRLFGRRSKKTSKLRVTGLCAGNSPGPVNSAQRASNVENVSIWWRHHVLWRLQAWWRTKPGHQQVWYCHSSSQIFLSQHQQSKLITYLIWNGAYIATILPLIGAEWGIYTSVIQPSLVQIMTCRLVGAKP